MAKKYDLTETQIRHLAIICYREQGNNDAGVRACASHMCNYFEKWQSKRFSNIYECVFGSGWYWTRPRNETWVYEHPSVPQAAIDAVRDVMVNGNRTLPEYVDEYDCLSDIKEASNNGTKFDPRDRTKYQKDVTRITNVYGSEYTFYCFPDGAGGTCDAFGYISKPTEERGDIMVTAETILNIARGWLGRNEYDGSHRMIIDLYNSHAPLARSYKVKYTDQWCDTCLSAMFIKANAVDLIGGTECGVEEHVKKFKAAGIWIEDGAITPQAGDIIVYNWDDSTQPNDGYSDHIGIVEVVNGKTITTIEGNYKDSVSRRTIPIGYGYIRGYARPKYGMVEEPEPVEEPAKTTDGGDKYMFTTETVQNGSKGASARLLQKLLRGLGYYGANGKMLSIDGDAGTNTIHALQSYQRSNGLTADGICGPVTWAKIIGL